MYKTKITSQGTISLPAVLRKKYQLHVGDIIAIEDRGVITIVKAPDFSLLREKNKAFSKKKINYKTGDGFSAHVTHTYGKKN